MPWMIVIVLSMPRASYCVQLFADKVICYIIFNSKQQALIDKKMFNTECLLNNTVELGQTRIPCDL